MGSFLRRWLPRQKIRLGWNRVARVPANANALFEGRKTNRQGCPSTSERNEGTTQPGPMHCGATRPGQLLHRPSYGRPSGCKSLGQGKVLRTESHCQFRTRQVKRLPNGDGTVQAQRTFEKATVPLLSARTDKLKRITPTRRTVMDAGLGTLWQTESVKAEWLKKPSFCLEKKKIRKRKEEDHGAERTTGNGTGYAVGGGHKEVRGSYAQRYESRAQSVGQTLPQRPPMSEPCSQPPDQQ